MNVSVITLMIVRDIEKLANQFLFLHVCVHQVVLSTNLDAVPSVAGTISMDSPDVEATVESTRRSTRQWCAPQQHFWSDRREYSPSSFLELP